MKKLLLPIFTFIFCLQSFGQDYVSQEVVEIDLVRSGFSLGISPIVYVPINEYSDAPGLGLELIGLYGLDKNFSVGGFLKVKSEINPNSISTPGNGYNGSEKVFENVATGVGAIFEYKIFSKVGFNLKLGYEDILASTATSSQNYYYSPSGGYVVNYDDNDPGATYGGGISLYIRRADSKRAVHSFNWGITFESNNNEEVPVLDLSTNTFKDTKMNAFYLQFGWRIQIHGLKPMK